MKSYFNITGEIEFGWIISMLISCLWDYSTATQDVILGGKWMKGIWDLSILVLLIALWYEIQLY